MKFFISLLLTLLVSHVAQSHGEDKAGPNGGYIRMPGSFHTEVKVTNEGSFDVYLLDIQFSNPTVKDSEVKASVLLKKNKTDLICSPVDAKYFHCKGSRVPKAGTLIILAKRENVQGAEAHYKLPLKLEKTKKVDSQDHSHHH